MLKNNCFRILFKIQIMFSTNLMISEDRWSCLFLWLWRVRSPKHSGQVDILGEKTLGQELVPSVSLADVNEISSVNGIMYRSKNVMLVYL